MPIEIEQDCPLAIVLAARLRASRDELTTRWLERISARVSVAPVRVFPTETLLDHVPLLIDGIADYLESPAKEISGEFPVIAKARELGQLRHAQGFDQHEIAKEYEILGGILFSFVAAAANEITEPCEKGELLTCGHRLFRAVAVIQQATMTNYLRLADERVAEREGRLRAFNRTVSHEIKNRIGTILGASEVMRETLDASLGDRVNFVDMISRNARELAATVENLIELSRVERDARRHRHVLLADAAREACRQLRESAEAAGVQVRISPDIPPVDVNAGAVELCLTNYVSNAIKYANPSLPNRSVEISAAIERASDETRELVVRVADNGLGVPMSQRDLLFQLFFRADSVATLHGTGLGLSIVRDTIHSLGGRAWAEFPETGSIFAFSLPIRRGNALAEQAAS